MSTATVEIAPAPPAGTTLPAPAPRRGFPRLEGATLYAALAAGAVGIAALSLLLPSTPSYDPWAWLIWGREIVHLDLHTVGGPSWKPLPVLFTTLFAPFGGAAPDLWLVVARAGALAGVVMAFRVAWRLTRGLADSPGALAALPALVAGAIAAASVINSRAFVSDNALGYSEGLATALVLIALDRHLDGARRQAFVVGFFAALDRPEVWLVWVPYGAYLFWRDSDARKMIAALFALIPALWFLPELWGSGHLLRGVTRAQHPRSNSPAFTHCPFCTEFSRHAWRTVWTRVKLPAIAVTAAAAFAVLGGRLGSCRRRVGVALLALAAAGFGWWVVVALETQAGFSGNDRYLALSAALVSVAGGVAWGWGILGLSALAPRIAAHRGRVMLATSLVAVAAFVAVPSWIGSSIVNVPTTRRSLSYQAKLREDLGKVVASLGGRSRILRCGTVMTEGFQVPMVAWVLGVHVDRIQAPPPAGSDPGPAPNVVFQARATRTSFLLPILGAWTHVHYVLNAHVRTFRVYSTCTTRVGL